VETFEPDVSATRVCGTQFPYFCAGRHNKPTALRDKGGGSEPGGEFGRLQGDVAGRRVLFEQEFQGCKGMDNYLGF